MAIIARKLTNGRVVYRDSVTGRFARKPSVAGPVVCSGAMADFRRWRIAQHAPRAIPNIVNRKPVAYVAKPTFRAKLAAVCSVAADAPVSVATVATFVVGFLYSYGSMISASSFAF